MTPHDAALHLLRRHARTAVAWQILNPGMHLWLSADRSAAVGYAVQGRCRIAAGPPVASLGRLAGAAAEFETDAALSGQTVCYFGAETVFKRTVAARPTHRAVLLGAQPVWDPAAWSLAADRRRSVLELARRAARKTVSAGEVPPETVHAEADLRRCLEAWRRSRPLPFLGFALHPDVLSGTADRRIFALRTRAGITAFATVLPMAGRSGWLIETIARDRGTPTGSAELLIDTVMRTVAAEGAEHVTLGLAPLSRKAPISYGSNPLWLRAAFKFFYAAGGRAYNFAGLDAFKAKFVPDRWEPVYAVVNRPRFSPAALGRVARAFAGGSFKKFAASALKRAYHGALQK